MQRLLDAMAASLQMRMGGAERRLRHFIGDGLEPHYKKTQKRLKIILTARSCVLCIKLVKLYKSAKTYFEENR